jgi:hypothetical protein
VCTYLLNVICYVSDIERDLFVYKFLNSSFYPSFHFLVLWNKEFYVDLNVLMKISISSRRISFAKYRHLYSIQCHVDWLNDKLGRIYAREGEREGRRERAIVITNEYIIFSFLCFCLADRPEHLFFFVCSFSNHHRQKIIAALCSVYWVGKCILARSFFSSSILFVHIAAAADDLALTDTGYV